MNSVKCACGFKHLTFENFFALTLPIPSYSNTLNECLNEYTKSERISEFFCSKCKHKSQCDKKTVIWRFPPILLFQLKRFTSSGWRKEKLETTIKFPTELNLESYKGESSNNRFNNSA